MSKEKVVFFDNDEKVDISSQQINYNISEDIINESTTFEKELVIVFEEDNESVYIVPDKINYDLSDKLQFNPSYEPTEIKNDDDTLIITKKNNETTINTAVIRQFNSIYDFPNRGKVNVLYINLSTRDIYYWDDLEGEYVKLNDFEKIKIINGGEAEWLNEL